MICCSILNHKGGTAKTTTTLNLGVALSRLGKKVLIIDLDFQANLTYWTLGELPQETLTITNALLQDCEIRDVIQATKNETLFIAPSNHTLKDFATLDPSNVLYRMKKAIRSVSEDYDIILMDHAPNLTLVTLTGLVASQYALVPVSCEILPIVGIRLVSDTLNQILDNLEHEVKVLGYLMTIYDRRVRITSQVEEFLIDTFNGQVFKNKVRVNSKLKEAPGFNQDCWQMKDHKGMDDYDAVAKEMLKRIHS